MNNTNNWMNFFRYIAEKTGLTFKNPANPDEVIYKLYNILQLQSAQELPQPEWCTRGVLELLEDVVVLHHEIESHNPALKRLTSGMMLKFFMVPRAKGMYLQAGEDRDIAALLSALGRGRFSIRLSKPGTAIILEKWSYEGDHYVNVVANLEDYEFQLLPKGCPELCAMQMFMKIVGEALPNDLDLQCILKKY